jgi:hypothetical protein
MSISYSYLLRFQDYNDLNQFFAEDEIFNDFYFEKKLTKELKENNLQIEIQIFQGK